MWTSLTQTQLSAYERGQRGTEFVSIGLLGRVLAQYQASHLNWIAFSLMVSFFHPLLVRHETSRPDTCKCHSGSQWHWPTEHVLAARCLQHSCICHTKFMEICVFSSQAPTPPLHASLPDHQSQSYQAPIESQPPPFTSLPLSPTPSQPPFPISCRIPRQPRPWWEPSSFPFPGSLPSWAPPKPRAHLKPHQSYLRLKPPSMPSGSLPPLFQPLPQLQLQPSSCWVLVFFNLLFLLSSSVFFPFPFLPPFPVPNLFPSLLTGFHHLEMQTEETSFCPPQMEHWEMVPHYHPRSLPTLSFRGLWLHNSRTH